MVRMVETEGKAASLHYLMSIYATNSFKGSETSFKQIKTINTLSMTLYMDYNVKSRSMHDVE